MKNHNDGHKMKPWTIGVDAALFRLDASRHGLTDAEARLRLEYFGPNRLKEKPPRPAWMKFLDQFKDLLVIVLIGAAALAGAIGDIKDAVVILIVVMFNACLGFYQEHRADATLAALKKMLAQHARIRRGGEMRQIPADELVPGDIALLEAGDRVPADARVLAAHNAEVAEAALTGESHAAGKYADALPPGEYPLAERGNMVFMNTVVTRGRIEALVAATGMKTEMWRITGTEVAREAATMVLTDDNFATIVGAVREGRTIYDNIVKFVRFQLSTNIGAMLTVLGAQLLGLPTPFTAIQILWINIIMDGPPAMTLGMEPAHPGIMNEPPRSTGARILTLPRFWRLLGYGAIMTVGTIGVFYYGLQTGEPAYALTLAFTTFVLFQFFNVFNARAEFGTAFNRHFFANGKLWAGLGGVVGLQAVAVHWGPAQEIFHTVGLAAADWGLAFAVASSVLLLEEARKLAMLFSRRGTQN